MLQPGQGSTQVPQAQLFSELSEGHFPREQMSAGGQFLHTHYSSPLPGHSEGHQHPPQKLSLALNLSEKRSAGRTGERRRTPYLQRDFLCPLAQALPRTSHQLHSTHYLGQGPNLVHTCQFKMCLQGESSWQLLSLKQKKTVNLQ